MGGSPVRLPRFSKGFVDSRYPKRETDPHITFEIDSTTLAKFRNHPTPFPYNLSAVFPLLSSTFANRKKTANDIDESQDGVIKRMEWIRYTAVLDEGRGM